MYRIKQTNHPATLSCVNALQAMVAELHGLRLSSKYEDFITTIGLDIASRKDVEIYNRMLVQISTTKMPLSLLTSIQSEVDHARMRLTYSKDSLLPHLKHDPSIIPPFTRKQIEYMAFLREARQVYECACPETRAIYDFVSKQQKTCGANIAIQWLLWHALCQQEYVV